MIKDSKCVVFVCDKKYLEKFINTCSQLITIGKYDGQICLIIGDDLKDFEFNQIEIIRTLSNKLIIKHFNNINFSSDFLEVQNNLNRPGHWNQKMFQYHKFNLFDEFFKQWNYIMYIDCGMTIFDDITPILNECYHGCFLANRDGVDNENGTGLLIKDQFIDEGNYFEKLQKLFGEKLNYHSFQTTMLLFDSKTNINKNTKNNLINLSLDYPISKTNDQGVINLYFSLINPVWRQIKRFNEKIYFYDYVPCVRNKYIMIKLITDSHIDQGYVSNYIINYNKKNIYEKGHNMGL